MCTQGKRPGLGRRARPPDLQPPPCHSPGPRNTPTTTGPRSSQVTVEAHEAVQSLLPSSGPRLGGGLKVAGEERGSSQPAAAQKAPPSVVTPQRAVSEALDRLGPVVQPTTATDTEIRGLAPGAPGTGQLRTRPSPTAPSLWPNVQSRKKAKQRPRPGLQEG